MTRFCKSHIFYAIPMLLALWIPHAQAAELSGPACAIDGDSLVIGGRMAGGKCKGGDVEIRLQGIDAPEWDQTCGEKGKEWACGKAATAAMRAMIEGKAVACKSIGRDRYKRTLATCTVGGEDIQRRMVRDGMAMAYRKYSKKYIQDEVAARLSRLGIWSGPFMEPSEWRHRGK